MKESKIIRSAFWIGRIKAGCEQRFQEVINDIVMTAMRKLPGVHDANALWPLRREDNPPHITCQVIVEFKNQQDLDLMLASLERQAMRADVKGLFEMFDGTMSHIEYQVG